MAMVQDPRLDEDGRPLVSVCIANYNGQDLLRECIDSVLAQECEASVEIIVHDDASSDGSVALVRHRYPQVVLLASDRNVGFCASNNRMVAQAKGRYILLLNNDAALYPDAIQALLSAAASQDGPAILGLPQYDRETGALVDRGCMLDPFFNPVPNLDGRRRDVAYVIAACLWIPREQWHALNGMPEWMESLAEDLYLCGVARLRCIPVRVLAGSGYRHRQGATFGGNRVGPRGLRTSIRRRRLSERNKTCALVILTPGGARWPLLAAHLIMLAIEGAVMCLIRRDTTLWREVYGPALATPWRERFRLAALRHEIQSSRTATPREWFSTVRWQLRKFSLLWKHGIPDVA